MRNWWRQRGGAAPKALVWSICSEELRCLRGVLVCVRAGLSHEPTWQGSLCQGCANVP